MHFRQLIFQQTHVFVGNETPGFRVLEINNIRIRGVVGIVGSLRRIDERLAAKLLEELRACTSYFNRATVITRDFKVLGSLAFSAVGELARSGHVAPCGRSYLEPLLSGCQHAPRVRC
jgi:hypothetical protein